MSTTYHAATIVGCKIDRSKIFFNQKVRQCEHLVPEIIRDIKFCPKCGKEMWIKKEVSIPEYDEDKEALCGFRTFFSDEDDCVFVAGEYIETDNNIYTPIEMLSTDTYEIRKRLKTALEPFDLWDERQFGIWLVTWYS